MEFKTIDRPYLIQRGKFRDIKEEEIAGLDSLISYDYMGSSEFEWGALPGRNYTRCDDLQDIFDDLGRGSSYGMSTTHMSKLLPRIEGGGGAGCPILVIGMKKSLYLEDM